MTALDDLRLPPGLPRMIVACVGENENGALRSVSQGFMDLLTPYGLTGHVLNLREPGWTDRLRTLVNGGVLFAWGAAGVGSGLQNDQRPLWESLGIPFISVMADSPCWMPGNHHVASAFVANGYVYRDWLAVQRRLIRSPQISALLPHGVLANPGGHAPWSRREHRMVFVKTGCAPEQHRAEWAALPPRFRTVLEDTSAAALQQGVEDITGLLLDCLDQHGLQLDGRPDVLFGLQRAADVYVRDHRSTAMVQALLELPADIIGRGWGHAAVPGCRARFHPPMDADALPPLYAGTQFLLNTMPNLSSGTHERVPNGFAAGCVVVSNENTDMDRRFGSLPSYFGVDTEARDLADQLAELCYGSTRYDGLTQPARDLAAAEFNGEAFVRALIDLAMEVRFVPVYTD